MTLSECVREVSPDQVGTRMGQGGSVRPLHGSQRCSCHENGTSDLAIALSPHCEILHFHSYCTTASTINLNHLHLFPSLGYNFKCASQMGANSNFPICNVATGDAGNVERQDAICTGFQGSAQDEIRCSEFLWRWRASCLCTVWLLTVSNAGREVMAVCSPTAVAHARRVAD